ncbi:flagellar basal body rod protein FlgC [Xanthomonas sp. XNM01]|uniref:flagellar basal body rod protein FlgC n=1 Tax=Xanthomonas sp. XNM01 TaxID=2769289 RepID=UPI00177C82ED|nr:flagellar basal body rod protein FlgC [Xanthomonas sp. XNM01]MBD9368322.1 flagellar basal body rod protein FlgC [Xanthomonas sp. XNM01]
MSNLPIFDVAGSGLQAQSVRMSTIASNLANADSVAGSAEAVYKPIEPLFQAQPSRTDPSLTGVRVREVSQSEAPPIRRYEPGHPLADGDGYVFAPDVDPVAQMVNLISASRSYQAGVEVINTAKELAMATLTMGR